MITIRYNIFVYTTTTTTNNNNNNNMLFVSIITIIKQPIIIIFSVYDLCDVVVMLSLRSRC